MSIQCTHCGATNDHKGRYCVSCATILPAAPSGRTRPLLPHEAISESRARREKHRVSASFDDAKKASIYLFVTAGLALLTLLLMLGQTIPPGYQRDMKVVAVQVTLVVVLAGLAFWARRQPLPAAVIGLTLLITLWLVNAALDPTSLAQGLIMKIILIAGLMKAIQYGLEHRRLVRRAQWHG